MKRGYLLKIIVLLCCLLVGAGSACALQAQAPETGQTVSYGARDDGALTPGVPWPSPRFTAANGAVTDNLTGLVWLQNANCFGVQLWGTALTSANSLASGACGLTDGSTAGDWRLPTRAELKSLVDASKYSPALPAGHPFSAVQADLYWSSSTSAANTSYAWALYMYDGGVAPLNKTFNYYVWPVRGGQFGTSVISVSPSSKAFGSIAIGGSGSQTITISNGAAATSKLQINAVSLRGANPDQFSFTYDADGAGGNPPSNTPVIAPGVSTQLVINFNPTSAGAKSATLRISGSDVNTPNVDIPLSGTGTGYTVTGSVSGGNGSISSTNPLTVDSGATASFTVAPATDYQKVTAVGGSCPSGSWSGSQYTTGTISADCTVDFSFTKITYPLTVTVVGAGSGTVHSAPAPDIACSGNCSQSYDIHTPVSLSATAGPDSTFGAWSGACSGSGACNVTMEGARSVGASFLLKCAPITSVTAPASSTTGVYSVSWSASTAGATYTLYENGTPIYTGSATSFPVDWTESGSYSYTVKATKAGYLDSDLSGAAPTAVTLPARCSTTTGLFVASPTNTSGGYQVYWYNSSTPGASYVLTENGIVIYKGKNKFFNVSGRTNGTYNYQVKTIKRSYDSSPYTAVTAVTVTLTCSLPGGPYVSATNTSGSYQVYWQNSATPGASYTLYENGTPVYTGSKISFNVSGRSSGSYAYRLKVSRSGYNDSPLSATASTMVTLTCAIPAGLYASATSSSGSYQVYWQNSATPGVSYTLYENGTPVYTGSRTSYNVSSRANGSYAYRLKASRSGYNDSPLSAPVSTTVTLACAIPGGAYAPATSSSGSYQVYWQNSATPGVSYTLYENGTPVYTGSRTSYNVSGRPNGSYAYRVKATRSGYIDSQLSGATTTVVAK